MKKCLLFCYMVMSVCLSQACGAAPTVNFTILGISGDPLKNTQARLAIELQNTAPLTEMKIQTFYQQGAENIRLALQPFGYFNPVIKGNLSHHQELWQATYQVNLGPAVTISQMDIKVFGPGASESKLQKLLAKPPLKKGERLETEAYDRLKQKLLTTAEKHGYISAQLTKHSILVDTDKNQATIILYLDTGPRYYFGPILFSPTPFDQNFLQRFLPFKLGQAYSTNDILILQNNLRNSNYFQSVTVEPQRQAAKNYHIPIQVQLKPRKKHQYSLGIGYGTDTGVRGTLGWDWRRITSTGHHFSALLTASEIQRSLQGKYVIPGANPLTDQFNINGSLSDMLLSQGFSHKVQFGVAQVNNVNNWQRTIALNYQIERFQLNDQPSTNSYFLIPSISWQKITADKPLATTRGNRFNFTLKGAAQGLLSDTNFAQAEVEDKYIYSPSAVSRIILRGDVGYTIVHYVDDLPPTLQFFAGGSQSIRGFNYQNLGPGRYLMVGSIEYQHRIIDNWNWAIFYDAGNAFNHFFRADQPDPRYTSFLQQGAGIGIVWQSPVGPMELSLARALTKQGRHYLIQFNMGSDL